MRPWKRMVLLPTWPANERVPASTSRVLLRAMRFLRVGAARFSEKMILVPTGTRLLLWICASLDPRRQVLGLTLTGPTAGSASVVKVASAPAVVSVGLVASRR